MPCNKSIINMRLDKILALLAGYTLIFFSIRIFGSPDFSQLPQWFAQTLMVIVGVNICAYGLNEDKE